MLMKIDKLKANNSLGPEEAYLRIQKKNIRRNLVFHWLVCSINPHVQVADQGHRSSLMPSQYPKRGIGQITSNYRALRLRLWESC